MFFFTYLAKELRRRLRQAVFIALGLAVGVGLVLTVTAAAAGVRNAQASVLKGLYGVATDLTVTGSAPSAPGGSGGTRTTIQMSPNGAQLCVNSKCHLLKDGYTIDNLGSTSYSPISATAVTKIAGLHDVTAVAGGLVLTDNQTTISANPSLPTSFSVDGTDLADQKLGPLSDAVLTSGRDFTMADADKNVALVDKSYATPSSLANEVSGSLTNAAKLANDLGKWLSILVLVAAFALAVLLTMAAVARRVREFGTLKALGWSGRRVIAQVMGESFAVGLLGAAVGVGLGFAGAAIINAIAPKLSSVLSQGTGERLATPTGSYTPTVTHTVLVPLTAAVSGTAILIAVLLALGGGLLAGAFASWRIGRLRPAAAIAKVG